MLFLRDVKHRESGWSEEKKMAGGEESVLAPPVADGIYFSLPISELVMEECDN